MLKMPPLIPPVSFWSLKVDNLRQAVEELREWRADHEDILRPLGFCSGLPARQNEISTAANGARIGAPSSGAASGVDVAAMDVDGGTPRGDDKGAGPKDSKKKVTLQNLSACIHAAEKITVGRSLKEVREMRAVVQRVNEWIEQCQSLCPRRQSKRRVQPSSKPTFDRLKTLIAEGLASPVGVSDEVERIRKHIAEAESCQRSAQSVLDTVCAALADQTLERQEIWRKEGEESEEKGGSGNAKSVGQSSPVEGEVSSPDKQRAQSSGAKSKPGQSSDSQQGQDADKENDDDSADESDDVDREDELDEAEESSETSLEQLLAKARDITVFMPEELVAEKVQKIMEWARYSDENDPWRFSEHDVAMTLLQSPSFPLNILF